MQAVKQIEIIEDDWTGLYRERWKGLIVEAATAHPAKFARGLIRKIYQHAFEEGWLASGDTVVDCFGGVALGAHGAIQSGLDWVGIELEAKFVELGTQNIALWSDYYRSRLSPCGTARLLQGDSRRLAEVIRDAVAVISSPPYAGDSGKADRTGHERAERRAEEKGFKQGLGCFKTSEAYGRNDANLGGMPNGDFSAVIASPPYEHDTEPHGDLRPEDGRKTKRVEMRSYRAVIASPPFVESLASDEPEKRGGLFRDEKRKNDKTLTATYGETGGQLGRMKAGEFDAVVTSPPYVGTAVEKHSSGIDIGKNYESYRASGGGASFEAYCATQAKHSQGYGNSDGQLGALPSGEFDAVVSSPPYEGSLATQGNVEISNDHFQALATKAGHGAIGGGQLSHSSRYSFDDDNLGNQQGDTFWAASRTILEQCFLVLRPGAHAIWVLKGFVRQGEYVDFPDQWRRLSEVVGFKTLHLHRSWLVEHHGKQQTFAGEDDSIETHRKSFFRRLAESKGSPAIDFEVVLCCLRP